MKKQSSAPLTASIYSWSLYCTLVIFRLFISFKIQPGYLHPDEFFQGVEVAAGDIYNIQVHRTWEFSSYNGGPLRSIAGLGPVVYFPIWFYKFMFNCDAANGLNRTFIGRDMVKRILLPTRLTAALSSLTVDMFILIALSSSNGCKYFPIPPISLFLYSTAAFGGLLLAGRTIVNAWETSAVSMFGILFILVMRKLRTPSFQFTDFALVFAAMSVQAVLSTWALFLRPTYAIFVVSMAVVQLFTYICRFQWPIIFMTSAYFVLLVALTARLCMVVDTAYFLGTSIRSALSLPVTELICIPYRFFMYNSNSSHVASHGLHPRYFHILVNMPLILGPLIPVLCLSVINKNRCTELLWWLSVLVPLFSLSLIPHQEARFLMPIVPFILILSGESLERWSESHWKSKLRTFVLPCWFLHQLVLFVIFGCLHQAGLIMFFSSLPSWTSNQFACQSYVFYHTYMPPRFPLGLPVSQSSTLCNAVIDLHGAESWKLRQLLHEHLEYAKSTENNVIVNVIYPGSLSPLSVDLTSYGTVLSHKLFFGHISLEEPPQLGQIYNGSLILWDYNHWYSQFSLHSVALAIGT